MVQATLRRACMLLRKLAWFAFSWQVRQVSLICLAVLSLSVGTGPFSPAIWLFMCSATFVWQLAQLWSMPACLRVRERRAGGLVVTGRWQSATLKAAGWRLRRCLG